MQNGTWACMCTCTHTNEKAVYFVRHLNDFILHIIQLIDYSPMSLAFVFSIQCLFFISCILKEKEEEEERDGWLSVLIIPALGKWRQADPKAHWPVSLAYLAFPAREVRGLYTVTKCQQLRNNIQAVLWPLQSMRT